MGRGQGLVAGSLQPRRMCACGVYLILGFVQISNRSPPQLKSEASVPIFCGRECLYPIPLSTCLNIYFVNRDMSQFYSFPFPAPTRGNTGPGREDPLFQSHYPSHHPPLTPPSAPEDSPSKGASPTRETSPLGEGGEVGSGGSGVCLSLASRGRSWFSSPTGCTSPGPRQNSGTSGRWARPLGPLSSGGVAPHAALPIPRPDGAGPPGPAPRRHEAGGSVAASRCCRGTRPPDPPSLASAPRNAAPRAY